MTSHYLELTLGAVLVYNFVLSRFLGICPFLGVSKRLDTALGMSGAVIFVMTLASLITSIIYNHLLSVNITIGGGTVNLAFLRILTFIVVIGPQAMRVASITSTTVWISPARKAL